MRSGGGGAVMRTAWWACSLIVVLTSSVAYQLSSQPLLPDRSSGVSAESERPPLDHKSDRLLVYNNEARLHDVPSASPDSSDRRPIAQDQARLEDAASIAPEDAAGIAPVERSEPNRANQNLSYLAYYAYSELPPETKPADIVLNALKGYSPGTPVEEIKRITDVLGLDFTFMKAVAKIESGFNPKQRTGSYIGLFQLSRYEFKAYGSGNITDARDNAIAGAYKFATEALLFEFETGRKPTFSDLYLIHQQGWQGAAQHVSHPKRIAWKSMCATDEGKEKGARWCKRAIWGNTLPAIKHAWKSVDKLTSSAFMGMWQQRVDDLYACYSLAAMKN